MAISQKIYGAADWFAGALGMSRHPLSATELMGLAQRRTGLTDFGDTGFVEPLQVLVRGYNEQASLSTFGRIAARWDALRFLSNLLMLRDAEKKNPAILDQSVNRTIFITGMPRSGSSFLHRLLSQDRSNRVVRSWQTIYPCPPDADWDAHSLVAREKVDRQLSSFARLAPELRSLHPISARTPQECTEITGHVFRSLRFDTTHYVPDYTDWLDNAGHVAAYRFHERFLKHLQHHEGSGHWILKCPDHAFALDAISAVYPDARFVFMHRDPLEVLPSVAKLTETLRRPFTRRVDRSQIGGQVSERWARGAARLIEAADRSRGSDRILHVRFRAFLQDPLRFVAAIYECFNLSLAPEVARRIRDFIAAQPTGGYGGHRDQLEAFGLEAQVERRRFQDYVTYFGV